MHEAAVKAGLWVSAQVRMCDINAMPAVVSRRGDPDAGSILLRLDRLDGHSVVLSQARDADGRRCWLMATGSEPVPDMEASAYIERRVKSDPDLWVVEIEDRHARYEPDAPIIV